jgi:ribosomal protein L15
MKVQTWFKTSFGTGAVALALVAGLAFASPVAANVAAAPLQVGAQHRGGLGLGRGGVNLTAIAGALGMTEAELRTELQSGKSVADVASAKGVALDTVVNAVIVEQTTALNRAVADGRLTQAQADVILANLKATLPGHLQTRLVPGLGGWGFGGRGRGHGYKGGFGLKGATSFTTIAATLKMTPAELVAELRSGKSVADVAGAKGVSLDAVIAAIVDQQTRQLSAAVAAGRITQAQADAVLANLKENLPELLALKGGPFGPGFGRWPSSMPQPPNADTNL